MITVVDTTSLRIPLGEICLAGTLAVPPSSEGLVVFVHRGNPFDVRVASLLHQRGLSTLLLDVVTLEEARQGELDVTVGVRADRLIGAVDGIVAGGLHRGQPIGLFGGELGATAALITAARRIHVVSAVVCHGGRPDLAGVWLAVLRTPTLLIVGSRDTSVLRVNRDTARTLVAPHKVAVIPGAAHRFEEPGAIDEVAAAAGTWFTRHLFGASTAFPSMATS